MLVPYPIGSFIHSAATLLVLLALPLFLFLFSTATTGTAPPPPPPPSSLSRLASLASLLIAFKCYPPLAFHFVATRGLSMFLLRTLVAVTTIPYNLVQCESVLLRNRN